MRKIPTLFERDWDGDRSRVLDVVNPAAAWVIAGEGTATQKVDGTSCRVSGGRLFKRYELRPGKTAPQGFEAADDVDPETGKQPGWVPVGNGPEDAHHREAWDGALAAMGPVSQVVPDDTYELLGPKVQGNPEHWPNHGLTVHGANPLPDVPRDFEGLRAYLSEHDIEGVVWHHPDGRMAKIKGRDFGIKRAQVVTRG